MRSTASIEIDQPIEDVFRLATDDPTAWSLVLVEDTVIEDKPGKVGTTFRAVTEDHGKRMEFDGVITRFDPPYANAIRMTNGMFNIESEFTFEDLSGRTRVTQVANVSGKGFAKVMMFAFGWMMKGSSCKSSQNELASLKRLCEDGASDST